ncbi:hypothetical protein [Streptomyces sp. NPDC087437]|uniref:hypothetical protein n=1 Tax=Streptomyces sp. NPDC087437 TaxID=3365789 RepID=UPI003811C1C6
MTSEVALDRGNRIMCFTDGLIEEHEVERTAQEVRAVVRSLATLLPVEWRATG